MQNVEGGGGHNLCTTTVIVHDLLRVGGRVTLNILTPKFIPPPNPYKGGSVNGT